MANDSNRQSQARRLWLPGCSTDASVMDLNQLTQSQKRNPVSPSNPKYHLREVRPVQESPTADVKFERLLEEQPLSPVSEHGQKMRSRFRKSENGPVSEESSHGSISIDGADGVENDSNVENGMEGDIDPFALVTDFSTGASRLPTQLDISSDRRARSPAGINSNTMGTDAGPSQPNLSQDAGTNHIEIDIKDGGDDYSADCAGSNESSGSFVLPSSEINSAFSTIPSSLSSHGGGLSQHDLLTDLLNNFSNSSGPATRYRSRGNMESTNALIKSFYKKMFLLHNPDSKDRPSFTSFALYKSSMDGPDSKSSQSVPSLANTDMGVSINQELKQVIQSQCTEPHCSRSHCLQVQECFSRLKNDNVDLDDLTSEDTEVLWHMYDHCCSCDRLHCPLYWCQKSAKQWPHDQDTILTNMKHLTAHFYHGNFLQELTSGTFYKFVPDLPFEETPVEGQNWDGLIQMSYANSTIMAQTDLDDSGDYWIIKKSPMFRSHSQIELYEELRKIKHKGMVIHLWSFVSPLTNLMAVCSHFEAYSLCERLQDSPIQDLHSVVILMSQLISTTRHLHHRGILYLNWSSKNVLCGSHEHLKLTNFTCSALKSKVSVDIMDISNSLPPHLLAPEMLDETPTVDEATDIRGLGCLMKEMVTGRPVWHEFQHEPEDFLHRKILEQAPVIPDEFLYLHFPFTACWEIEREERPNLEGLKSLLAHAEAENRAR